MANPAVVVDFVANTKDLQKGFQEASGKASGFGSKLKGLATSGALAGVAALTGAVKVGVEEFAEAQKVTAQTNATLKSTGKVAGVTAKQVGNLAESIMKKSGIDDEAIQSGENLLLTFTNIRNEVGKGNDIFDQATKAAVDMSVALGTDVKGAAMQLGKALNDPLKGMTKLQRSGVTFTEEQKEMVKSLVGTGNSIMDLKTVGVLLTTEQKNMVAQFGDLADPMAAARDLGIELTAAQKAQLKSMLDGTGAVKAQKLMLGELNKEFGGSAEAAGKTLPGQLNILKQEFSNFAGEVVTKVIPVLLRVVKILNDNRTTVLVVGGAIAALTAGVLIYNGVMAAYNAVTKIATAVTKGYAIAVKALNFVMKMNPIGLVITALTLLVAGLIYAYKHSETFRKIVDGAFKMVKEGAVAAVDAIKAAWNGLVGFLRGLVDRIGRIASGIIGVVKDAINFFIRGINNLRIPGFNVNINMPSPIPDIKFGWAGMDFPDIPYLAKGGVVTRPTLAMIGEAGPEAVLPLDQARGGVEVRVFIGDQELRGLVRTEIADSNTGIARTLLGGAASR